MRLPDRKQNTCSMEMKNSAKIRGRAGPSVSELRKSKCVCMEFTITPRSEALRLVLAMSFMFAWATQKSPVGAT